MPPRISVVISTHNPHAGRLRRALAGLRDQTLAPERWETIVVDNASTPALESSDFAGVVPVNVRVVREPRLGLTAARRRGLGEAQGALVVMVDDDNVLASDYLAAVVEIFGAYAQVGIIGGKSLPEFETPPEPWVREFEGLLACRDLGETRRISSGLRNRLTGRNEYPDCAPIGAGMALRADVARRWLDDPSSTVLPDRRGAELTSGGDNDIVLTAMRQGWEVGYFPELVLTHLIPTARLSRDYLARLNRGIAKSWVQVLAKHDACPWGAISRVSVPLRQARAWFTCRAWAGPADYIRWQGACGHFQGRASVSANGSIQR